MVMAESFNQTFIRAYRYIRSSSVRTALAVVVLVILLFLLFLGVQFVAQQRGSLALLNGLNLLLIPLLLIGAVVWLANTWKGTQMEMARLRDERALVDGYYDRLTDLLLSRNLRGACLLYTSRAAFQGLRSASFAIMRWRTAQGSAYAT